MSQLELTGEQQIALNENDGFIQGAGYVLISQGKYREMMGVGGDAELAASLTDDGATHPRGPLSSAFFGRSLPWTRKTDSKPSSPAR